MAVTPVDLDRIAPDGLNADRVHVFGNARRIEAVRAGPLVDAVRTGAREAQGAHRVPALAFVAPDDRQGAGPGLPDLRGPIPRIVVRQLLVHCASLHPFSENGMRQDAIAILGGTGDQGLGLALRFAKAGRPVVIGSRKLERAEEAAAAVRKEIPDGEVEGLVNEDAAGRAPIVILSVPFEHFASTVKGIRDNLAEGQIVVSMGVPLATAIGDGAVRTVGIWQGSCAELVKSLVPAGVQVVSAFQNVPAQRLQHLAEQVDCDVLVSGARVPRERVMELCELVPGLRAVNAGPLANARIVEAITALLIGLNARYKVSEGLGIRITGLPDSDSSR